MEKLFKKNIWGERKDTLMRKCLKEKVLRKIGKKIEASKSKILKKIVIENENEKKHRYPESLPSPRAELTRL